MYLCIILSRSAKGLQFSAIYYIFLRLASLGAGPQAHVHMEGMKCRVLYLNVLGTNALFL